MRPKPFAPKEASIEKCYVRDETSGLTWHRVFNRSLYADTDRSQVVYHANYLRYFEMGRAALMRDMGYPYKTIEDNGYVYPVIETGAKFHRPLHYDDPMWIHTRPLPPERVKIRFDYLITHAESGEVICTGFTGHCALNLEGKPVQVDEQTIGIIRSFPE